MTHSILRLAVLLALAGAFVPSVSSAARRPELLSVEGPAKVAIGTSAVFTASFLADRDVSASWTWGNGSTSAGLVSGTTVRGSHAYTTAGTFTVSLRIDDGRSSTAASRTIEVYNPAPRAASDSYNIAGNEILNVPAPGVLANDSDPSGAALASALLEPPLHGSVALNPDGSFAYSPFPDYQGVDAFTYAASNGTFTSSAATVSITVGAQPEVDINDLVISETTGAASFAITLSAASSLEVSVTYATADDSAAAPDDYARSSGTVVFAPGVTSQTIRVAVTSDSLHEATESFFVDLASATNARVRKGRGKCTIDDDDGQTPTISIADVRMYEGNAGVTLMRFPVTLSAPSLSPVSVSYRTVGLGAQPPEDFVGSTGVITFAPGTTTSYVVVAINGDTKFEGNEYFYVQLYGAVNATIFDSVAIATIVNDDSP